MKSHFARYQTIWIFSFIALLYWMPIAWYPLLNPDESRYAKIVREMIAQGDWITPRLNGLPFFDKPILFYWLQSLTQSLMGISTISVRLNIVLFGLLGGFSIYFFTSTWINKKAGFYSAIALLGMPIYFVASHYANLDLLIALFISLSISCFYTAFKPNTSPWFLLFAYLFVSLGFLTKGLIALVFPAGIGGIWLLLEKYPKPFKLLSPIYGMLFCFLFIFPWFFLVEKAHPGFLHYYFIVQHFERYLSLSHFNNAQPIWFYFPIFLLGTAPWSIYLFYVKKLWQHPLLLKEHKSLLRLTLIWMLFTLIFFSIPKNKIITYILPAVFPLAIYIGLCAQYMNPTTLKRYFLFSLCSSLLIYVGLLLGIKWHPQENQLETANFILKQNPKPDWIVQIRRYDYDLSLYLNQNIHVVNDWNNPRILSEDNWERELYLGTTFEKNHPFLISDSEFCKTWSSQTKIIAVLRPKEWKIFSCDQSKIHLMKKIGNQTIIRNY